VLILHLWILCKLTFSMYGLFLPTSKKLIHTCIKPTFHCNIHNHMAHTLIYSADNEHLGCFQFPAITKNVGMNISWCLRQFQVLNSFLCGSLSEYYSPYKDTQLSTVSVLLFHIFLHQEFLSTNVCNSLILNRGSNTWF